MATIKEMIQQAVHDGYTDDDAPAKVCQDSMILNNPDVRQNTLDDICDRLQKTFSAERFATHLNDAKNNWLDMDSSIVTASLIDFIRSLKN